MTVKTFLVLLLAGATTVNSQHSSSNPLSRTLANLQNTPPNQRDAFRRRRRHTAPPLPPSSLLNLRGGGRQQTVPDAPPPPVAVSGGTATVSSEVFNLVKAIVGVGVLSLPAGITAFGSSRSAVLPAVALIAVIGALSGFGFAVIGKVCAYTGANSYRQAWDRSVSESTGWIPAWSATGKTSLACLAYSMVLADTFSGLLGMRHKRTEVLLGLTTFILLPLCWMKSLAALAPFSLLGVIGMAYTGLAMTVRLLDKSYELPTGDGTPSALLSTVAAELQPKFGTDGWKSVFSPSALILVCMLSTAYMAHFNAPKFYLELQNNTLPRFNGVVTISFTISIILMAAITAVGYLTFGSNCAGLVLNNYAAGDIWMAGSRIAVALALVFSYPLAFQGCRDGIIDLAGVPLEKKTDKLVNGVTMGLLAVVTFFAAVLKDVSFVLAFGGATLGNALTFVYPAIMYYQVVKKQNREGETLGVTVAVISGILGVIMGAIGAMKAVH